jgi:hypothetical protein
MNKGVWKFTGYSDSERNIIHFFVKTRKLILHHTMIILRNAYLQLGWALKGNQKFGRKGTGTRISKEIVSMLQGFFLAGNANKSDRYSEQDMYDELVKLADKGEIDRNKIPKIQTIKEWISRYSRQLKKAAAEKASEDAGEGSESNKRLRM